MIRCLLVKFPDDREFFTNDSNLKDLENFAKVFATKTFLVEADDPTIHSLEEIIKFFCDQSKESVRCNYKVRARQAMLEKVSSVRSFIETRLEGGETVRVKELHRSFRKHNVAVSTLYRHLDYVKKKIETTGKKVVKVSTGCYRLDR